MEILRNSISCFSHYFSFFPPFFNLYFNELSICCVRHTRWRNTEKEKIYLQLLDVAVNCDLFRSSMIVSTREYLISKHEHEDVISN